MTDRLTLLGTAVNKRPEQLLGRVRTALKAQVLPRIPIDIDTRYERGIPDELQTATAPLRENTVRLRRTTASDRDRYKRRAQAVLKCELSFLSDSVDFEDGQTIDLDSPQVTEQPIHWRIKCFGFEHLRWTWLGYESPSTVPKSALSTHRQWLDEWIDGHAIARETGYLRRDWTPHAVSLRICNWARYDAWLGDRLEAEYRRRIRRFIWKNAAFLSDNVEYGVGGNHLVENAIALLIAGLHFDRARWIRQAKHILQRAVDDQLLPDGGHIERSPMYHLIVCQRLVTAVDLFNAVGEDCGTICEGAVAAATFADRLCPPDDCIPLLNDSAFGEALPLPGCLSYATSVLGEDSRFTRADSPAEASMPDSGYYWLGEGSDRLLAVAGEITTPHIPAHAHAHPAQICVWAAGERVITDTGVYEYAAGDRRRWSRSVSGHNTVQVDGGEPVRFAEEFLWWGTVDPEVEYSVDDTRTELRIDYTVDTIGTPKYRHERRIVHRPDQWTIRDRVEGIKEVAVDRLHVHPQFEVEFAADRAKITGDDGTDVLTVESSGCESVSVARAPYYPRYGRERDRDVIECRRSENGVFELTISPG